MFKVCLTFWCIRFIYVIDMFPCAISVVVYYISKFVYDISKCVCFIISKFVYDNIMFVCTCIISKCVLVYNISVFVYAVSKFPCFISVHIY